MTNLEKVERFHRLKERIEEIVRRTIKKDEIIHGERAVEVRVPPYLRRHTRDYDVFSETPKKDAEEAEQELDEEFRGDFFEVIPAEHPGTFKVKSKIDGRTYADFSEKEENVPIESIQGNNYATLEFVKKKLRRILKDKTKEFRHKKDQDTLNRIRIYEQARERLSLGLLKQQVNLKKKHQLTNMLAIRQVSLIKTNSNLLKSPKEDKIKFL